MIIGVDAGALSIKDKRLQVGVYQVTVNLLQQLARLDRKNNYTLYTFSPIDKNLLITFGPRMQNVVVTPKKGWAKVWLPLRLMKDKPDVYLALNQMPIFFKPPTTKVIGIFHDLTFKYFPTMYPGSLQKLYKGSERLATQSAHIVAVSEATKNDIKKFYHVPLRNITVAYEGVRDLKSIKTPKITVKKDFPYFLFVGALKRQKNIPTLIKAFTDFCSQLSAKDRVKLIIVGPDAWLDPQIQHTLKQVPEAIREKIIFKQFVDDTALAFLYRNALALVGPSLYEGFGLPFVEAMSLGCPVIGSNAGAVPEVVGQAGILVKATDASALSQAMKNIYKSKKYRKQLIEKGRKQAKKFSWESFARSIFSIIEK